MYIFISLPTTNNNNKLTGYKVPGGGTQILWNNIHPWALLDRCHRCADWSSLVSSPVTQILQTPPISAATDQDCSIGQLQLIQDNSAQDCQTLPE